MKLLEIKYDFPNFLVKYALTDGQRVSVCPVLSVSASCNPDGTFTVCSFSSEKKKPNDARSSINLIEYTHVVSENEECEGIYSRTTWSYLKGIENVHYSYCAKIVDDSIALENSSDPVIKAHIYLSRGLYNEADKLLEPVLPPDKSYYYFVNLAANKLQAQRYENGIGVEKNLDKAYIHYLYARSYEDIARFMEMGYGKNVFNKALCVDELLEFHTYMLLHAVGETEYAEYRVSWNAGCWIYKTEEKESQDPHDIKERKSNALCRKQYCEWAMSGKSLKNFTVEKFILYIGAYFSYLENGHEGRCTYTYDDSYETSVSSAKMYLESALEKGDELAIRAQSFIDSLG